MQSASITRTGPRSCLLVVAERPPESEGEWIRFMAHVRDACAVHYRMATHERQPAGGGTEWRVQLVLNGTVADAQCGSAYNALRDVLVRARGFVEDPAEPRDQGGPDHH